MLSRDEIIELVNKIIKCEGNEENQDKLIDTLEQGVLDPDVSDYIFYSEMTAEEIAYKVLCYKSICL